MIFALEGGTTALTLSSLLTDVGSVLSSAIEWMGSVSSAIAANPILLLGVLLPFVGFGVGLFRRMLNV